MSMWIECSKCKGKGGRNIDESFCGKCKQNKPLDEFYIYKNKPTCYCKICAANKNKNVKLVKKNKLKCIECGAEFLSNRKQQKFCSRSCNCNYMSKLLRMRHHKKMMQELVNEPR